MGTAKRERQKQGRQARIEEARAAQQRAQRFRTARNFGLVVVVILVALVLLSQLTGKNDTPTTVAAGDTASSGASSTTAATTPAVQVTVPPAGAAITGDTPCPDAGGASPRTTKFEKEPPTCIVDGKTYTAKVDTTKGSFTIALDPKAAPKAVNSFVVLARYHYYDGVAFHRIIPGFVVQGGDAVGPTPGKGGPGYEFADELPTAGPPYYPLQSVAMANSGANTNGSQFFVVTGDQGTSLPAKYTRFGSVTDGFDVVKQIEAVGSPSGDPTEVVTITAVTITES